MTSMRLSIAFVACLVVTAGTCRSAAPPADEARSIAALIERLSAEEYDVREDATCLLSGRDDVLPALRKALRHPDLEVRKRSARILSHVEGRLRTRALDRASRLLTDGDWDVALELLLRWGTQDDVRGLDAVCKLVDRLLAECKPLLKQTARRAEDVDRWAKDAGRLTKLETFGNKRPFSSGKLEWPLREVIRAQKGILRASEVQCAKDVISCLILANGDVEVLAPRKGVRHPTSGSVVLANGAVKLGDTGGSVVICDGPVAVDGHVAGSIIIARGEVCCRGPVDGSVIISGGAILSRRNALQLAYAEEGQEYPFHRLRYFAPHRLGIEVKDAKLGVQVEWASLPRLKAFSAAGVREGDVIAALDGQKVEDREHFRRLLRPHAAERDAFTLALLRKGKRLDVRVSLAP
jgi:hypothetical protein